MATVRLVSAACLVLAASASAQSPTPTPQFTPAPGGARTYGTPPPTTPMARYLATLREAVGKSWHAKGQQNLSALGHNGRVELRFWVSPKGKVTDVQAITSPPNKALADLTVAALAEAEIPPVPRELADLLPGKGVEAAFTFDLF